VSETDVKNHGAPESGPEPRIGRSISLDHAAQVLGVSRRTIYNRIREGRLQTIRTLGGSQRAGRVPGPRLTISFSLLNPRTP